MRISRFAPLACLLTLGCSDPAPAPAPAAPATAAPAPPSAAPETVDPAAAKARFDARVSQPLPAQLPRAWRGLVDGVQAKVLSARHAIFSRVDGADPRREVSLVLRAFGDDAALDAKMRGLLAPWPDTALEIDRVKGAPPRESQYAIEWARRPADPRDAKGCRSPKAVDLPPEAPRWLDRVTNARSTRRRVGAETQVSSEGRGGALYMRYRNGYAQDEAIRHFTEAARRAGYTRARGEALDQTWTKPDGARVAWSPFNDDLHLGCAINGPVLRFSWREVAPAR